MRSFSPYTLIQLDIRVWGHVKAECLSRGSTVPAFPLLLFTFTQKNPEKARLAKEENTESGNRSGLFLGNELSPFLFKLAIKILLMGKAQKR